MDEEKILAQGKIDLGRVYLEIDGDTPTTNLQEKSVTITTNTLTEVEPDEGYDGLSKVNVTTNIPTPTLEEKNVTILENGESEITPSEGYDGISKVNLIVSTPQGYDWSSIGFDKTPEVITQMIQDAEYLLENYDTTLTSYNQYNYDNGANRYLTCVPNIDTSNLTSLSFYQCSYLLAIADNLDVSNITNFSNFCNGCSICNAPKMTFGTGSLNGSNMFRYCSHLKEMPVYDFSNFTNLQNAFGNVNGLSDTALDNLLQSLITATQITTKTLYYVGFDNPSRYPLSRLQSLPHYNDFVNAGWSMGY